MSDWLLFLALTLGAAMIPGPNTAIILRNTLNHSRRAGFLTLAGLASSLLLHGLLSLLGISALLYSQPALFDLLRWGGGAYLLWLGGRQILQARAPQAGSAEEQRPPARSAWAAWFEGVMISLVNPKILIFFLAVFAQILSSAQSLGQQLLYVATPALAEVSWFTLVILLLSHPAARDRLQRIRHTLERLVGAALIAFGIKLGLG